MSFIVKQPGLMSILQDSGRFGTHNIGLTTGGPLDSYAYTLANALLENAADACAIEVSFGGLKLQANVDTFISITGANIPVTINERPVDLWTCHQVIRGDIITLGMATQGTRTYIGVAEGFQTPSVFGSRSTVMREKIGGINGGKLTNGDLLPCTEITSRKLLQLPVQARPEYAEAVTLRLVLGYQQQMFDAATKARFFSSEYTLTDRADRMGMRLEGPDVACGTTQMLSEGICHGAVQVPADGQPIVLLNDRQTIGGYPKIGAIIAADTALLAQCRPGAKICFEQICQNQAHNIRSLEHYREQHPPLCDLVNNDAIGRPSATP